MDVDFAGKDLSRLYADKAYKAGYDGSTIKAFRLRIQQILAAPDEGTFAAMKSFDYRQIRIDGGPKWSMKLNGRGRLILGKRAGVQGTVIVVEEIADVSADT
jgi:plasmid maintenance system killer protein